MVTTDIILTVPNLFPVPQCWLFIKFAIWYLRSWSAGIRKRDNSSVCGTFLMVHPFTLCTTPWRRSSTGFIRREIADQVFHHH